jgi:SAM-dependent methyltransferase
MIELARVAPGERVIDIGCGPGALTEVLSTMDLEALVAVDPSESFVSALHERLPEVDVRQATAEALPFPDDAFDAALAQLVVHFMSDPAAGVREMARVTRTGGVVAASVWDFGGGRGPLGPFWEAARELDPDVVDESVLAGARQGHLVELFRAAGLRDVEERQLAVTHDFDSFDAWWQPFTEGVGPAGAYIATLSGDRQTELRERCRSMTPLGPFTLTAVAWAASGLVT